jgi:NhaP-type Na+/H+ or K+/H+ antiporter
MHTVGLTVAVALAAGVLAQSVSRQLRLPGIVLLLGTGALLGPDGLSWVEPRALGDGLFGIVDFGIAIILFEGGLNLEWSRLKRQEAAIRRLITLGAVVTVIAATGLSHYLLGWGWELSLLFGSLVVVTGPTVVAPLLRDMRLRPRLRTVLEAEGVFIDPIGALLAAAVLQVVAAPMVGTLAAEAQLVAASLGFGILSGVIAGLVLAAVLRNRYLVARGYEHIFTLAGVVLLFEACGAFVAESGLMAVTVAGVVVGNLETRVGEELREFKDRLTVMLVGLLFVLLAADVPLDDVRDLGVPGLLVVGGLIFAARPLAVWLSTGGLGLPAGERVFMAAVAPRGIVAAAVTSLTAATLDSQGIDGGDELKALVFLVIGATVVVSGVSARPLSTLLAVRLPRRDRVAILGARGLALALAEQLRDAEIPVVFLEPDPKRTRVAQEAGFTVVFGDPLEERTMLRARPELVGTAVGLTFNEHLNSLFVRKALDSFGVSRGLVATESLFGEQAPSHLPAENADVLFDGPHDHERWDVRWRHGQVVVEPFVFEPGSTPAEGEVADEVKTATARSRELFVIVSVRSGSHVSPMRRGYSVRPGDVASVAIHAPERDAALELLAAQGWEPIVPTAPTSTPPPV